MHLEIKITEESWQTTKNILVLSAPHTYVCVIGKTKIYLLYVVNIKKNERTAPKRWTSEAIPCSSDAKKRSPCLSTNHRDPQCLFYFIFMTHDLLAEYPRGTTLFSDKCPNITLRARRMFGWTTLKHSSIYNYRFCDGIRIDIPTSACFWRPNSTSVHTAHIHASTSSFHNVRSSCLLRLIWRFLVFKMATAYSNFRVFLWPVLRATFNTVSLNASRGALLLFRLEHCLNLSLTMRSGHKYMLSERTGVTNSAVLLVCMSLLRANSEHSLAWNFRVHILGFSFRFGFLRVNLGVQHAPF